MPKTYNSRERNFMRLEAEHAPPAADTHETDLTRYIRFFPADEIARLIERITARVEVGKVTQLRPETAYLVTRALRVLAAEPRREDIVREICGVAGGCGPRWCMGCIGKANAIMGLYEGCPAR